MGLDTFAVLPQRVGTEEYTPAPDWPFAGIELCGGIFSGGSGSSSFRGKVYNDYISEVTGVSLYQEYIPPARVREMALALEVAVQRYSDEGFKEFGLTGREEAEALARWFRIAAENGYALYNWW